MLLSNDSESTPPTYNVHVPFLRVLTDLNFSIDQSLPSDHPLVIQLVEFFVIMYYRGTPSVNLSGLEVEGQRPDGTFSDLSESNPDDI